MADAITNEDSIFIPRLRLRLEREQDDFDEDSIVRVQIDWVHQGYLSVADIHSLIGFLSGSLPAEESKDYDASRSEA